MAKTSTQESVQNIDPMLRDESIQQSNLVKLLASFGWNPYQGATIADFSEGQKAAASMADNAASAFGFTGGAREGMNIGGKIKDAATGIMGWSPFQQMKQQPGYEKLMQQLEQFRKAASKQVDYQEPASTSGGKK